MLKSQLENRDRDIQIGKGARRPCVLRACQEFTARKRRRSTLSACSICKQFDPLWCPVLVPGTQTNRATATATSTSDSLALAALSASRRAARGCAVRLWLQQQQQATSAIARRGRHSRQSSQLMPGKAPWRSHFKRRRPGGPGFVQPPGCLGVV